MKYYPERIHEFNELCDCGHRRGRHEWGLLNCYIWVLTKKRLPKGKCNSCLCPSFTKEVIGKT